MHTNRARTEASQRYQHHPSHCGRCVYCDKVWGVRKRCIRKDNCITKILLIFVVTICILQYVMASAKLVKQLTAQWIAVGSFWTYRQVIHATIDGRYNSTDAQLVLQNGIPRF